jgi:hypothetical protein
MNVRPVPAVGARPGISKTNAKSIYRQRKAGWKTGGTGLGAGSVFG